MDNLINVSKMDRIIAVLIYNGKIYEDSNHQYALEFALKEDGKSLGIDLEDDLDKAVDMTCKMNKDREIATLSVFYDGKASYLITHLEESLELYSKGIKEYAKENDMILGTFIDSSCNCKLIA